MPKILIDTNALIILILGMIDPKLISKHKRTSIYEETDFWELISLIPDFKSLIVLPNVWTEVDNILNHFNGGHKQLYIEKITETIKRSSETYVESTIGSEHFSFYDLGLTDALILTCAKECSLLITSDTKLSDYANALGITVFDIVKNRNERL